MGFCHELLEDIDLFRRELTDQLPTIEHIFRYPHGEDEGFVVGTPLAKPPLVHPRVVLIHDFEELKVRDTFGTTANNGVGNESTDMVMALPSETREIYSIIRVDSAESQKLIQVPSRQWDSVIPYPEYFNRAAPTHYRRWGDNIELWHVPDAIYTIRGHRSKWPTTLVNDTDLSDIDRKDDLIITLTMIWLCIQSDRQDRANHYWAVFKTLHKESISEDEYHPDLRPGSRFTESMARPIEDYKNPFSLGYNSEQVE